MSDTQIQQNEEVQAVPGVSKDTMIGELLMIDRRIAQILFGIGMHCVDCPASQMETIAEAAMVHGVDADELVDEINDFLRFEA